MSNSRFIFLVFIAVFITSCLKRIDGPIELELSNYPKVEINLDQVNAYKNKIYYNLSTKSIVHTANSLDWQIAFANNPNSDTKIIMNYALGKTCNGFTLSDTTWSIVKTDDDFLTNKLIYANHYDSFANLFSEANKGFVYFLNFGKVGYKKVKFLDIKSTEATFKYSNLDGSNEQIATVPFASNTNFTYFSMIDNTPKIIEPDKSSWDLEFTHYTTFVTDFNQPQMYGVTGVLTNPSKGLFVAKLENKKLEDIITSNLGTYLYTQKIGQIGYDWKKFSNGNADGFYTILTKSFIINDQGKYYGIQFVGFSKIVDNKDVNGYPQFLLRDF